MVELNTEKNQKIYSFLFVSYGIIADIDIYSELFSLF
jgi:hypothetical protein